MSELQLIDGEFGGAKDTPDERDYVAAEISSVELTPVERLPEVLGFDRSAITLLSQKNTMSCTAQAAANCAEMTYFNLYQDTIHIPVLVPNRDGELGMWEYQLDVHPRTGSRSEGDWTRSAMRALVHRSENGGIPAIRQETGDAVTIKIPTFAKIERHADTIRQWLFAGYAVVVSGDVLLPERGRSNWTIAKQEGYLTFPEGWRKKGGHAVCIITGYDWSNGKREFVVANSYGDNYGHFGNGTFRIHADDVGGLHQSLWVCFPDGDNLDEERLAAADAIRKAKAIWAIADKIAFKKGMAGTSIPSIKQGAHNVAEAAREFLRGS